MIYLKVDDVGVTKAFIAWWQVKLEREPKYDVEGHHVHQRIDKLGTMAETREEARKKQAYEELEGTIIQGNEDRPIVVAGGGQAPPLQVPSIDALLGDIYKL